MLSATIATTAWLASRLQNQFTTAIIIAAQSLLVFVSAWLLMGFLGVLIAAVFVVIIASRAAQQSLPTLKALGALPLHPHQAPELFQLVHILSSRAGLPPIPLFIIPSSLPNALATGDNHLRALALTSGLLSLMNPRQLAGILAHEISHLRQHDIRLQSIALVSAHLVAILSNTALWLAILSLPLSLFGIVLIPWYALFWLILAAPASALLGLWLSRTREFRADLEAVALTNDPLGLASALALIESPLALSSSAFFTPPGPHQNNQNT
jgi:heat shock protein HtpX